MLTDCMKLVFLYFLIIPYIPTELPHFSRAMAIRVRALKNKNSIELVFTRGPTMVGAEFAVSQNQINLNSRLKTNANLRCVQGISKPYLPSLPNLNTMKTVNHKRQFHKHC